MLEIIEGIIKKLDGKVRTILIQHDDGRLDIAVLGCVACSREAIESWVEDVSEIPHLGDEEVKVH